MLVRYLGLGPMRFPAQWGCRGASNGIKAVASGTAIASLPMPQLAL